MYTIHRKPRFGCAVIVLFSLSLLPATVYGQQESNVPPPPPGTGQTTANLPSLEQNLVPEGVFATQLAEALKVGSALDEAKAESGLSAVGIEPKSGWISDYPVTPTVIGDIEKGVSNAAEQGKIAMGKDEALKVMGDVKAKLGLDVNPGPNAPAALTNKPRELAIYAYTDDKGVVHYTNRYESVPKEYRDHVRIIRTSVPSEPPGVTETPGPQSAQSPSPEVIDDYYDEEGPPVVTYYPPPEPYLYLYSWVPYPFWNTGFYFPGFFILQDFHRRVFFHRHPYFVAHHVGDGGHLGPVGPANGVLPGNPPPHPMNATRWFASPSAQSGARAIVTFNQNHLNSINAAPRTNTLAPVQPSGRWTPPMGNNPAVLSGQRRQPNGQFPRPPNYGSRTFNQPAFHQRYFPPAPPRVYSPPVYSQGRNFSAPPAFNGGGRSLGGFGGGHGGYGGSRHR